MAVYRTNRQNLTSMGRCTKHIEKEKCSTTGQQWFRWQYFYAIAKWHKQNHAQKILIKGSCKS